MHMQIPSESCFISCEQFTRFSTKRVNLIWFRCLQPSCIQSSVFNQSLLTMLDKFGSQSFFSHSHSRVKFDIHLHILHSLFWLRMPLIKIVMFFKHGLDCICNRFFPSYFVIMQCYLEKWWFFCIFHWFFFFWSYFFCSYFHFVPNFANLYLTGSSIIDRMKNYWFRLVANEI